MQAQFAQGALFNLLHGLVTYTGKSGYESLRMRTWEGEVENVKHEQLLHASLVVHGVLSCNCLGAMPSCSSIT